MISQPIHISVLVAENRQESGDALVRAIRRSLDSSTTLTGVEMLKLSGDTVGDLVMSLDSVLVAGGIINDPGKIVDLIREKTGALTPVLVSVIGQEHPDGRLIEGREKAMTIGGFSSFPQAVRTLLSLPK